MSTQQDTIMKKLKDNPGQWFTAKDFQDMNRATEQGSVVSLTPYKIMRLKDLEDRIDQLTNREEK